MRISRTYPNYTQLNMVVLQILNEDGSATGKQNVYVEILDTFNLKRNDEFREVNLVDIKLNEVKLENITITQIRKTTTLEEFYNNRNKNLFLSSDTDLLNFYSTRKKINNFVNLIEHLKNLFNEVLQKYRGTYNQIFNNKLIKNLGDQIKFTFFEYR